MTDGMDSARYLYSVVRTEDAHQLGDIGIEDESVYTIPYRDIAAVVHRCRPQPYNTEDKSLAKEWILEHSYVIDQATRRYGTVLPFSFDVIIRGDDTVVADWLKKSYKQLSDDLDRLKGKSEYSIHIYCDYEGLFLKTLENNQELKDLQSRIKSQSAGKAFLLRKSMDLKRKDIVSKEADRQKDQFCARIRPLADEMKVSGKKIPAHERYKNMELLTTCICLVRDDWVEPLGEILEEIQEEKGFAVKFTGPWAPFNFVGLMEAK